MADAFQLHQTGALDEAAEAYGALIEADPDDAEARHLMGVLEHQRGNIESAADFIADAILIDPGQAAYHNDLGAALLSIGRTEDARDRFIYALTLDPTLADPHFNLGCILDQHGDRLGAIRRYARAIAIDRHHTTAMVNLASALMDEQHLSDAEALLRRALQLDPEDVNALKNLGRLRRYAGDLDEALRLLDQGLQIAPRDAEAYFSRAAAFLAAGDFGRGFQDLEWRFRLAGGPRRRFPRGRWDGAPLGGKTILLHDEDDPTDAIQFARFIDAVAERGGRVVVECDRSLVRLFAAMRGVSAAVARGERMPQLSAYAPLISLPRILGVTRETLPRQTPYLVVPERASQAIDLPDGTVPLVGLVWADRASDDGRQRAVPLQALDPLLEAGGHHLVSLQDRAGEDELAHITRTGVTHIGGDIGDMAALAGAVSRLDLVIAVDAPAAHLAGALGRPVWTLVPYLAEWRWAGSGEDSLWYPTMRLFRQETPLIWQSVCARVAEELGAWLTTHRPYHGRGLGSARTQWNAT